MAAVMLRRRLPTRIGGTGQKGRFTSTLRKEWTSSCVISPVRNRAFHVSSNSYLRREDKPAQSINSAESKTQSEQHSQETAEKLSKLDAMLQSSQTEAYQTLNVTHVDAVHTGQIKIISLNRPKARNAISRQLVQDLGDQIESIHAESHAGQTRALVLTSEVDSAFCAGADLAERRGMTQVEVKDFLSRLQHTFKRISSLPIPSIACVNGYALGGGLELALCTNMRVFAWNAVVGLPETSLAIVPGGGGTYRLPQVIGLSKARELILTARRISALEALAIGLCNRYVQADDPALDSNKELARKLSLFETIQLAQEISRNGPVALRAAIQAMKDGGSEADENAAYETVLRTKDRDEALKAFAEKRPPSFTGE